MKTKTTGLKVLNIAAYIIMILINIFAVTIPIGENTTSNISMMYQNLLTPAPYTFSIWILIYALLLGFILYQAYDLIKRENNTDKYIRRTGWYFALSCAANSLWLIVFQNNLIILSAAVMFVLLYSLIKIYTALNDCDFYDSLKDKILIYTPFSIYLAWVCIAFTVNISILLVSLGAGGTSLDYVLLAAVMAIITYITVRIWTKYHDWLFVLTILWAYIGIAVNIINI